MGLRFSFVYFGLETSAFKLQPPLPIATHVAISDFQTELLSRLLLKGIHLRKRMLARLSYSPVSTLHPQVIYAVAFSAGLNGLHVD